MSTPFQLEGRGIAVTGAANGNGRAIAIALARLGAVIHVLDIDATGLDQTRALIVDSGGHAHAHVLDVSDFAACRAWADEHRDPGSALDGLVNNAGMIIREPLDSHSATENFTKVMQVNLHGAFNMTMACLQALRANQGSVVNIASIGSFVGLSGSVGYSASKGGLKSLTQSMACELAAQGIRVNAIAPGVIHTAMTEALLTDPARMPRFLARIPMGRVGTPDELWGAVAFLLSPLASYITGATLPVDGGYLAA